MINIYKTYIFYFLLIDLLFWNTHALIYFPGNISLVCSFGSFRLREFKRVSTNIHRFRRGIVSDSVSQTVIAGNGNSWMLKPTSSIVVSTGRSSHCRYISKTDFEQKMNPQSMKKTHTTLSSRVLPSITYLNPCTVVPVKYSDTSCLMWANGPRRLSAFFFI